MKHIYTVNTQSNFVLSFCTSTCTPYMHLYAYLLTYPTTWSAMYKCNVMKLSSLFQSENPTHRIWWAILVVPSSFSCLCVPIHAPLITPPNAPLLTHLLCRNLYAYSYTSLCAHPYMHPYVNLYIHIMHIPTHTSMHIFMHTLSLFWLVEDLHHSQSDNGHVKTWSA